MFCAPELIFGGPEGVGSLFMFCAPGLVFGGTVGIRPRFQVLRAQTLFQRYRGRQIPFLCFPFPKMFSAVPRVLGPFFMFCASELVFDGTEGVGSHFFVLCARTHFRWYRGRRVPFSCFALPNSFSAIPRTLGPFFMFCVPGLIFGGTEGVKSHFYVFRSRRCFRRYRERRVPFSCLAHTYSFFTVPRASGPVFLFCARGIIFGGTEGVGSRFLLLRSRLVFMFCAPGFIFGRTKGVSFNFQVFRYRTSFRRYLGRRVPFLCFARPISFSLVPRASVQFSCFAFPDSFSAVPRVSGPIFIFSLRLILGDTEVVWCRFHV
jgi:hypothetical protein